MHLHAQMCYYNYICRCFPWQPTNDKIKSRISLTQERFSNNLRAYWTMQVSLMVQYNIIWQNSLCNSDTL